MKRLLLTALSAIAVGCGNDNGVYNNPNSGTTTGPETPADARDWSSVFFDWSGTVEAPEINCASGRVTFRSSKEVISKGCGNQASATLSDADLARVDAAVAPVLANLDSELRCLEEAVMDYEVDLRVVSEGETRKVYFYNDEKTCVRGDRAAVENLEQVLAELSNQNFR